MNTPPVSIATAKAALIEQYQHTTLRRRATMLWGTRRVGNSPIVQQVAAHFGVPLLDLRLTTIEPVDIRGAIYADEVQGAALAGRRFHLNVQTVIEAWLAHAVAQGFASEVLAFLQVRPDKLDDSQAQLAADQLVGTSPRG